MLNCKEKFKVLNNFSFIFVLSATLSWNLSSQEATQKTSAAKTEYSELRQQALERHRAIIFNDDGDDVRAYPQDKLPFSIDKFFELRIAKLKDSHVNTISYSTGTFGLFMHSTKVGESMSQPHSTSKYINATSEFIKLKTDPLKEVVKFAHANGFEIWWSLRINDTHDFVHRPDKPWPYWLKLKEKHPEYLMGECGQQLPFGRWSAVNFEYPEIRELLVKYVSEVCENYDVDGVELDFFRHLYLFKKVVLGGQAGDLERAMLSETIQKIHDMTERVSIKKGRAVLLAVRVPDSIPYCKEIGIDLEHWMQKKIVDIIIAGGYFNLNAWDYMVNACRKYNVKIYAGLEEPRIRSYHSKEKEHELLLRRTLLGYRARAAEAWAGGVGGIYIFNEADLNKLRIKRYLCEIDSPEILSTKNKLHFVSYLKASPGNYLKGGVQYRNLPLLTPVTPITLSPQSTLSLPIYLGKINNDKMFGVMFFYSRNIVPSDLTVKINGEIIDFMTRDGDLTSYSVPAKLLKTGHNQVDLISNTSFTLLDLALLLVNDPKESDVELLLKACGKL
ncbi:MAG: hypothetical protein UT30_C0008G0012 [Candidatus Uhrbacteria bacterium GW2011_GWF2_39_13]|uniref:Glycosyl hydrolase-like 10 domain-containing protein n=1 Tax=Candidatus Uhrbacteria bacterium GW2011_GWF2_39_13 TaxID=1618995 RepID=A0A0G0Q1S7_9BACT|nr:MAG: hypothetical protein UT30_C0008G0012 [Candidatus Uhrbacteria bacterium GW2011_GWF2_39_13]